MPDESDLDPGRDSLATRAIPEVWRELVHRREPALWELVSGGVVARTGLRPDPERIREFLESLKPPHHLETVRTSESHPGIRGPAIHPPARKKARG